MNIYLGQDIATHPAEQVPADLRAAIDRAIADRQDARGALIADFERMTEQQKKNRNLLLIILGILGITLIFK